MARTTVEDCLSGEGSHFELAYKIAQRAREIMRRGDSRVNEYEDKPLVIALREIAEQPGDAEPEEGADAAQTPDADAGADNIARAEQPDAERRADA